MTKPNTIADAWQTFSADCVPRDASTLQRVEMRRAFYAGALSALTSKSPRYDLLAECMQFGLGIGTPAEREAA